MRELVDKHHLSCIILSNISQAIDHIKELNNYKIFLCSTDQNVLNNLYKQFLKYFDSIQIMSNNKLENKKITLCKSSFVKHILLNSNYNQDSKVDFCDLLIICDMTLNSHDNIFIGKLWNKLLKEDRQVLMPKLALFTPDPYINMDIDLIINKHNTKIINSEKRNIVYIDEFQDDKERLDLIINLTKQRPDKRCIIFCKTPHECKYVRENLKDSVFMDFEEFDPENNIFITFQHYQILENIDDVYDCLIDSKVYCKQRSELADNTCFRLMTKREFECLNPIIDPKMENLEIDVLRFIDKNIIFKNHQEIINKFKKDDFVNFDNSLTDRGLFCKSFDISPDFSNLMLESDDNDFDIFSCIVVASILSFMEHEMFLMTNKNIKEHFDKFFDNDHTDTHLELYLSVWNVYFVDFEGNHPSIYELMEWCKERMINVETFQKVIRTIYTTRLQYEKISGKNITETLVDPKQTCMNMEKIFKTSYNHKICKMVSKTECINHDFKTYTVDASKHYNPYVIEPTHIIPLVQRNNKILFYHPV